MKRFSFILLCSAFLVFGLTACGSDEQPAQKETGAADNREAETEETEDSSEPVGKGAGENEPGEEAAEAGRSRGNRIEDQSFQVDLRPLGEVTFASYEPDFRQDPLADAVFTIEKDGKVIQELPGVGEGSSHSNDAFHQVEAVSFLDYNNDGWDDVIVICSYCFGAGPDAGKTHSEIRYYRGSESGDFSYEEQMSRNATSALSEITIQTARDFIGAGKSSSETKVTQKPWRQAYLNYLENNSDVESQEGYVLIYMDGDEVPELVEIGNCEAAGCRIVNYSKGEVYVTQLNRLYFSYIENGNLLCNSEGNMDCYYDLVYSIVNGRMTLIAGGYYGAEDNSNVQFDEKGEPIYQYEWNGMEMSREEYGRALNSVYDISRAKDGYEWGEWYSADELKAVLED